MNRCAVAVGCPAARPGPAPQRRSPDERQDNGYISLGSWGHLGLVRAVTWADGRGVVPSGLTPFPVVPRSIWCACGARALSATARTLRSVGSVCYLGKESARPRGVAQKRSPNHVGPGAREASASPPSKQPPRRTLGYGAIDVHWAGHSTVDGPWRSAAVAVLRCCTAVGAAPEMGPMIKACLIECPGCRPTVRLGRTPLRCSTIGHDSRSLQLRCIG